MRKLPVAIAAASVLCAGPALAGQPEAGPPPPGLSRDFGGPAGPGERKTYGYEREGGMHRYGERGEALREGCKYITVRQRRGDEIVIRHFKRCD